MRTRFVRWFSLLAVAAAGLAAGRASKGAEPSAAEMAVRLAHEMAEAASRRDVKSLEKLIPATDRVVYVSNGNPITGRQYGETLGKFYASLRSLDFHWDRWEVQPIADQAAVFTGWATTRTVDREGHAESGRAIFTMVFARDATGWKRVLAQKWQDETPSVRAVYAAAGTIVPPDSPVTVHFSEAVQAPRAAFQLECPERAKIALTVRPAGDDGSFLLQPIAPLPPGVLCKGTVVASQVADSHFGQHMDGDFHFSFRVASWH